MMRFRATHDPFLVASGPGRLTQALNIGMNDNGIDVTVPNSIIVKNGIIPPAGTCLVEDRYKQGNE